MEKGRQVDDTRRPGTPDFLPRRYCWHFCGAAIVAQRVGRRSQTKMIPGVVTEPPWLPATARGKRMALTADPATLVPGKASRSTVSAVPVGAAPLASAAKTTLSSLSTAN